MFPQEAVWEIIVLLVIFVVAVVLDVLIITAWRRKKTLSKRLGQISPQRKLVFRGAQIPALSLPQALFTLAILLYLATRFTGLQEYPIYFFTDEAVHTVIAADMVENGFEYEGVFLPSYFRNVRKFNLSASVYAQVIPYLLFGKSVLVTRGTSVLFTLIAAAAVALMVKNALQLPYWWSATLLLSITPAWFLHSRTAFETVLATAFYAGFLYAYTLYRTRSPRYLYLALVFAALAFYAYVSAQAVVVFTALLLLVVDFRYHWKHRDTGLRGVGLLVLLALPYLRFYLSYPNFIRENLSETGSYWLESLPLSQKLARYLLEYARGLSPVYWYWPGNWEHPRHMMPGYGNILLGTLPFFLLGLYFALRNYRDPAWRTVLIGLLTPPVGAAAFDIGVTRVLFFVVPAAVLAAAGVSKALSWLEQRWLDRAKWSWAAFALLAAVNVGMSYDALTNGPTWNTSYGMYGMQYGAPQVLTRLETYMNANPNAEIILSSDWANGVDVLARFFLSRPFDVTIRSPDDYLNEVIPLTGNTLFVVSIDEYYRLRESGKFRIEELDTLPYPNGQPGFYFLHLQYTDDIEEILAAEREDRRALVEGEALFEGQPLLVRHSKLDMGEIGNIFDGDADTLIRTAEANPAVLEFTLPEPRRLNGMFITTGAIEARVTVYLSPEPGAEPIEITRFVRATVQTPFVLVDFSQTVTAQVFRVEIENLQDPEPANVHIYEIEFLESN